MLRKKTDYTAEQAELNALIRREGRGRRLTKAEEKRQIGGVRRFV